MLPPPVRQIEPIPEETESNTTNESFSDISSADEMETVELNEEEKRLAESMANGFDQSSSNFQDYNLRNVPFMQKENQQRKSYPNSSIYARTRSQNHRYSS